MITVSISFVDGSFQEYQEGPDFLLKLRELQRLGYEGKELVNTLITDDWAAPPSIVRIKGEDADGTDVDEQLSYF